MKTIQNAGEDAAARIRALAKARAWPARRDALTLARTIGLPDFSRLLATGASDRNWAVRAHAASLASGLDSRNRPPVEPALRALLDDRVPKVRLAAYKTLFAWHPDSGVLSKALSDPDPDVSYWAAQRYMQRARSQQLTSEAKTRLVESIIVRLRSMRWKQVGPMGIATLLGLGPGARDALYDAIAAEPADVRSAAVSVVGSCAGKAGLPLMLRFLDDPDPRVRRSAFWRVAAHCGVRHAPRLLRIARSDADAEMRVLAIQTLGRLRYKKAAPYLLRVLTHADYNVLRAALAALSKLGDKTLAPRLIAVYRSEGRGWKRSQLVAPIADLLKKDATDFLLEALRDQDRSVRIAALYAAKARLSEADRLAVFVRAIRGEEIDGIRQTAIRHLTPAQAPKALDALVAALKDGGPHTRRSAAQVIAQVRSPRAVRALIAAYRSETDPGVRSTLLDALGASGDKRVVSVLKKALNAPDPATRSAALNALRRFGHVLTDDFLVRFLSREDDETVQRSCLRVINARTLRDPRLAPLLAKLLEATDTALRSEVIDCLARIETMGAARALCRVLRDETESALRGKAVTALVRLLTRRRLQLRAIRKELARVLDTGDVAVRRRLVSTLATLDDRAAAPLLLKRLKEDSDGEVRRLAAEGLRGLADRTMVPRLLQAAGAEESASTVAVLIRLLGDLGDRRALPFLRKRLRDADPAIQTAALKAIATFRDASLIPFYIERLTRSTSAEVRLTSLRNLSGSGDRRALESILRAAGDEDDRVREAALCALADFRDADVAAALADRLCREGPDAGPMAETATLLARMRLRSVADRLLAAAKKHHSPVVRRRIWRALARMGDRRVLPRLIEASAVDESGELLGIALEAIRSCRAREHVTFCLHVMRTSVGRAVQQAAAVAVELGAGEAAVPFLARRIEEGQDYERRIYAPLLARAAGDRAEAALRAVLDRSPGEAVVVAICPLLSTRSVDVLGRIALQDNEPAAATAAVRSLGRLDSDRFDALFEEVVASARPAPVRAAALVELARSRVGRATERPAALGDVTGIVLHHIRSVEPEIRLAAVRAAGILSAAGDAPALVAAVISLARQAQDKPLRVEAVKTLAVMRGDPKAEAELLELLAKGGAGAPLVEVAAALGTRKSAAAVERLSTLAARSEPAVRVAAVEALGRIGTGAAIEAVKQALGDKAVDRVRSAAARALGRTRHRGHAPALMAALKSDPGLDVRAACAEALGRLGGDAARAALREALGQDSGLVREAAVRALAALKAKALLGDVQTLLKDPDGGVATAAEEAVRALSSEG